MHDDGITSGYIRPTPHTWERTSANRQEIFGKKYSNWRFSASHNGKKKVKVHQEFRNYGRGKKLIFEAIARRIIGRVESHPGNGTVQRNLRLLAITRIILKVECA